MHRHGFRRLSSLLLVTACACSCAWGQSLGGVGGIDAGSSSQRSTSAVDRWKSSRSAVPVGGLRDRLYGAASASMAESAGRQTGAAGGRDADADVYGNASRAMLPVRPGDTPLIDTRSKARSQP